MAEARDYRTDSEYIFHYSHRLSPRFIRTALLLEGYDFPDRPDGEPFRCLELGFGQGLSLNIHAAANEGEYWGTDFIPAHAARAQKMADAAGSNCTILCKSFAEMDAMSEAGQLPRFDLVVYHGVWSWVNDENRAHILSILGRTLKPGGVVYSSYNAMPGWAFFTPVRDLMVSLAGRYGDKADIKTVVTEILDYLLAFAETKEAAYFSLNPRSVEYLRHLKIEPPGYVAQEFLNESWRSFYFREVAADMARIDCKFVSSSNPMHHSAAAIRPEAGGMISQIINPNIRESLRDFALERKFRADYFVRSSRKLSQDEQFRRLGDCGLKLIKARNDIKLEVTIDYEKISLHPGLFNPIFDRLEDDGRSVKSIREVFDVLLGASGGRQTVLECLRMLVGGNIAAPATSDFPAGCVEKSARLNRELCREIVEEGEASISFLASPATGAGVRLTWDQMLMLHTRVDDPEEWAKSAAKLLVTLVPGNSYQPALENARKSVGVMNSVGLREMAIYGTTLA